METYNIASALMEMARSRPDQLAIAIPEKNSLDKNGITRYKNKTFKELAFEIESMGKGLLAAGFEKGDRVVMMVPPGFDFFIVSFSALQTGIVPVFIDPGIGLRNLKTCIAEAGPAGFIGISKAHIARVLFGWGKRTIHKSITIGPRFFWGGKRMESIRHLGRSDKPGSSFEAGPDDVAAIIFTSGSTGLPKGVVYSHGNFHAQLNMIRETFKFSPGEIDMPTFPPYALFNAVLGVSSVIPDMNPSRPAKVNPLNIINPIRQFGITNMFGSPALIDRVGRYGEANGIKLPTLQRVISSGGPVSAKALFKFSTMLEADAEILAPYGATESMPVSVISRHQMNSDTLKKTGDGYGICIGKPINGIEVSIIGIADVEIPNWSEHLTLPQGRIGEIVVKGENVTRSYYNRPAATNLAKIRDGNTVRHRMGDLGYFDSEGYLWFCGRKADRVKAGEKELYSIQCEFIFNKHPDVFRTALVDVNGKPVLCVEAEANSKSVDLKKLKAELLEMAAAYPLSTSIATVLFHPGFPVDIRHNAKIIREKLAIWAKNKLA